MRDVPIGIALGLAALAACASGEAPGTGDPDAPGGPGVDAPVDVDAPPSPPGDASVVDAPATPVDAPTTPIDAAPPIDAPLPPVDGGCTPTTTERLLNPAFDATPIATGWTETRIDPDEALIRADGVAEHSAPNAAWMGGLTSGTDILHQDVMIPAGTTALVLRGQYQVRTSEFFPGDFDRGYVELTDTAGTVLETVMQVNDSGATTAWTPFMRQFTNPRAGQTVRIRIRSTNDSSGTTSFYFDSLSLQATVCQ